MRKILANEISMSNGKLIINRPDPLSILVIYSEVPTRTYINYLMTDIFPKIRVPIYGYAITDQGSIMHLAGLSLKNVNIYECRNGQVVAAIPPPTAETAVKFISRYSGAPSINMPRAPQYATHSSSFKPVPLVEDKTLAENPEFTPHNRKWRQDINV